MFSTGCTFGEFKKRRPEVQGYSVRAFERIPGGFGAAGDSLYGNCDDLIVKMCEPAPNGLLTVYLGKKRDR